jgi:hypothetical protein
MLRRPDTPPLVGPDERNPAAQWRPYSRDERSVPMAAAPRPMTRPPALNFDGTPRHPRLIASLAVNPWN